MGAAKVLEDLGEGLYRVQRQPGGDIDGLLAKLADARATIEGELPKMKNTVAMNWDEVQVYRATVNALIDDWARGGYVDLIDVPQDRSQPTQAEKDEVVRLVNEVRAENGLPPLTANASLANAAQQHADWMGQNVIGHDGDNGSTPAQRIAAAGYAGAVKAENVAAGQSTPKQVVDSWMASPGHRANILNPDLKEIGIGGGTGDDYGRTWTQNFGAP